jgi:hypothetical protein
MSCVDLFPKYIIMEHEGLEFKVPVRDSDFHWESDSGDEWAGGSNLYVVMNIKEVFVRFMHEQLEIEREAIEEVEREREREVPPNYDDAEN